MVTKKKTVKKKTVKKTVKKRTSKKKLPRLMPKKHVEKKTRVALPTIKKIEKEQDKTFHIYKFPPLEEVNPNPAEYKPKKLGFLAKLFKKK